MLHEEHREDYGDYWTGEDQLLKVRFTYFSSDGAGTGFRFSIRSGRSNNFSQRRAIDRTSRCLLNRAALGKIRREAPYRLTKGWSRT